MNTRVVVYRHGDTPLTGFFAWDDMGTGIRPGILVVHGGAGLDDHAKGRARRLAALGFVVFACDMYSDGVAGDRSRVMARIKELTGDRTRLCERARAVIEVLASHPNVDGARRAAVGYCFGGMTVLELARSGFDLAGVVSVHGGLETSRPAEAETIKAKVLVCHGALDPHVPMTDVTVFAEEMNSAGGIGSSRFIAVRCMALLMKTLPERFRASPTIGLPMPGRRLVLRQFFSELFGPAGQDGEKFV